MYLFYRKAPRGNRQARAMALGHLIVVTCLTRLAKFPINYNRALDSIK